MGGRLGAEWGDGPVIRFTGGYRATEYPDQGTFDPSDPVRKDRTLETGVQARFDSPVFLSVGVLGSLNRSNSSRPEYDALTLDLTVGTPPFWRDVSAALSASITGKRYLTETEFARLVPGEEADNASVVFLELSRPVVPNVRGAVRLGWTRAETDIGKEYYERWGLGLYLNYDMLGGG